MRTTIRMPDPLLRRAKAYAAQTDRSLTQVIEDGVRLLLERESQPRASPGKPLPTASLGGLRLDVDLAKTSQVLELLDHLDAQDARR